MNKIVQASHWGRAGEGRECGARGLCITCLKINGSQCVPMSLAIVDVSRGSHNEAWAGTGGGRQTDRGES